MAKSVFTDEYRVLTEELTAARRAAGLSQQEVAERLERPQSYIAKVEGGQRRLDLVEFLELTAAIHTDPHKIIAAIQSLSRRRRRG